jgi:hypothetical protein
MLSTGLKAYSYRPMGCKVLNDKSFAYPWSSRNPIIRPVGAAVR